MKNMCLLLCLFSYIHVQAQNISQPPDTFQLQEVQVLAPSRIAPDLPISFHTQTEEEMSTQYYGQEPSALLLQFPATTAYSDAGNFWGVFLFSVKGHRPNPHQHDPGGCPSQ